MDGKAESAFSDARLEISTAFRVYYCPVFMTYISKYTLLIFDLFIAGNTINVCFALIAPNFECKLFINTYNHVIRAFLLAIYEHILDYTILRERDDWVMASAA